MRIELNPDWSEFLSALIARRVRFVLVGGHAVAGHGEPRFTEDLDVFVDPTLANGKRLRLALIALLANKRAAGRPKDLLDIAMLEALQGARAKRARATSPKRRSSKRTRRS